jgi:hypothetical protein
MLFRGQDTTLNGSLAARLMDLARLYDRLALKSRYRAAARPEQGILLAAISRRRRCL